MAFIEGFKKWVSTPYDDEDGEDYNDDQDYDYEPAPKNNGSSSRNIDDDYSRHQSSESKKNSKIVNINATAQLAVVLVKPTAFENAAEIADNLKNKRTVVLNLEQTNQEVARRLIDFLSGVAYANEGKIKRVANNTFIITPYNVDLLGDLMDELESSGLY